MTSNSKAKYTFGLLGERVDYSRSPEIFQSIFAADNVEGTFEIINCPVECLGEKLTELKQSGYDALCVTIPHKEAIVPFLDNVDQVAKALRSVNSVKFTESDICGLNTDTYGFAQPLSAYAQQLKGKTAIVLGAGGAARSVAYSLALDCEIVEVQFFSKGEERLKKTALMLNDVFPKLRIKTNVWTPEQSIPTVDGLAIIVNATPLGGPNVAITSTHKLFDNISSATVFYDLNYNGNGIMTAEAQQVCRVTLDGFPMLIHQALRSYYLWTGRKIEYDTVRKLIDSNATKQ